MVSLPCFTAVDTVTWGVIWSKVSVFSSKNSYISSTETEREDMFIILTVTWLVPRLAKLSVM